MTSGQQSSFLFGKDFVHSGPLGALLVEHGMSCRLISLPFLSMVVPVLGLGLVAGGCKPRAASITPPPPPEVTVTHPIIEPIVDEYTTTGRIASPAVVQIRARVAGYINEVSFQEGTEVKAGTILYQIDPQPFDAALLQAQAEVERQEALFAKAEADLKRQDELFKKKVSTQADYDLAFAERNVTKATVDAAKAAVRSAELNVEYATIHAPIDGRLSTSAVKTGSLVSATPSAGDGGLTVITQMEPMHVYFDVDERTVLKIRDTMRKNGEPVEPQNIRALNIAVEVGLEALGSKPRKGFLDFVDNRVNTATGTLRVRAVIENSDRLLTDGMFVRTTFPMGEPREAVLVPERAIAATLNQRVVYVVDEKNIVRVRAVKLGSQRGELREVTPASAEAIPLTPQDNIVVGGLQRVREGRVVKILPSEQIPAGKKPVAAKPEAAAPDAESPATEKPVETPKTPEKS